MKYYDALVRLAGNLLNEVQKFNLSAAEVVLLNAIHGEGAISRLKQVGEIEDFTPGKHRAERQRLRAMYAERSPRNLDIFEKLFGAPATPLPLSVEMADLVATPEPELDIDRAPLLTREASVIEAPLEDPVLILKQSIRDLGGTVPRGAVGVEKLREILLGLQQARFVAPEEEEEPESASVM